jgi:hypothetical protein
MFLASRFSDSDSIVLFGAILVIGYLWNRRTAGWIELPPTKLWQLAAAGSSPSIVIVTQRGLFFHRPCYLFPYHGVIFYSWSRPEELPPGVSLVAANNLPGN